MSDPTGIKLFGIIYGATTVAVLGLDVFLGCWLTLVALGLYVSCLFVKPGSRPATQNNAVQPKVSAPAAKSEPAKPKKAAEPEQPKPKVVAEPTKPAPQPKPTDITVAPPAPAAAAAPAPAAAATSSESSGERKTLEESTAETGAI